MQRAYSYVRFSSPEQANGDSLRRQTQAAEEWAKAHGFTLDDRLRDEGLSAFRGKHREKGSLGRFLNLVERGKIPKGSVLIVEQMDRLSREEATQAIPQFFSIVNAGVQVVTLQDGKVYSQQSINTSLGDVLKSVIDMDQAHQESEKKSKRLRAAWEAKRSRISEEKPTNRCPAWLEGTRGPDGKYDHRGYKKIPERSKVVRWIFQRRAEGQSPRAIVRRLNEKPDCWKPKNGWRKSYVVKILSTRAVIGEFQPHTRVGEKRQPVGDAVPNHFPPVVTRNLFDSVQEKIRANRETFKGGRTGRVSNLFSYLVKCGSCGGSVVYVNKGEPPKGGGYLVCDSAQRKTGCGSTKKQQYLEFEKAVLEHVASRLDISELLPDADEAKREIDRLRQRRDSVEREVNQAASRIANLTDSISDTKDRGVRGTLEDRLKILLAQKESLARESEELAGGIDSLESNGVQQKIEEKIEDIQGLMKYMKYEKSLEKLISVRLRLRQALRDTISEIKLYPAGDGKKDMRRYYCLWIKGGCRFTRPTYLKEKRSTI
jgi:DNA invertase Pin-like site-specific DNA recombinase